MNFADELSYSLTRGHNEGRAGRLCGPLAF